jgi:hypothetical protein
VRQHSPDLYDLRAIIDFGDQAIFVTPDVILLEKGEGTLEAQVFTLLRTWEYLASKISTLTLLALVENIVILLVGFRFDVLLMRFNQVR